jgi:hypothetical protein
MGAYLNLYVSCSTKKDEWHAVYDEASKFVSVFPLSCLKEIPMMEVNMVCMVRSDSDKNYPEEWIASGDYETMRRAESFYLNRDMIDDGDTQLDAGDAIMPLIPIHLDHKWDEPQFDNSFRVFNAKTQYRPYHIYLLAIACLIEYRLKDKAFVCGDISYDQCKKAVELINRYLDELIDLPVSCDEKRLMERIKKLPIKEAEKSELFKALHLKEDSRSFII